MGLEPRDATQENNSKTLALGGLPTMASCMSRFMKKNVPRLLNRYRISYFQEDDCIEYFITDKASEEQISYALVLSLDRTSKEIHVSKFYPELFKQKEPQYLSAVCFCLLIHHFGHCHHLTTLINTN